MSQVPKPYDRVNPFGSASSNNPSNPIQGTKLDAEFNAIEVSLDQTQARLAEIQRDDGALANYSVGPDQMTLELLAALTGGFYPRGAWQANTRYSLGDAVNYDGHLWAALVDHVSSASFAADLSSGKWMSISQQVAAQAILITPIPPMTATNVQGALEALNAFDVNLGNSTDPLKGGALVGRGAVTISSIKDLAAVPLKSHITVIAKDYHPNINTGGGGRLYYDETMPKSSHNGGTIFSPTVPWDGTKATLPAYLARAGESDPSGLGCWVRRVRDYYLITAFGAVPDWNGTTGFDNRPSIEACIKNVYHSVIPVGHFAAALTGSIFIQGYTGKRVSGGGTLHKTGPKGIFSFNACIDVKVTGVVMDGQITADEAANGNIWDGTRLATNFSFAVSFADCHDCEVRGTTVYDFSWDGLRATGTVPAGGATATQSTTINFIDNKISTVRGTQIWVKAVNGGEISHNRQSNPDTFAQKANAVFVVEWCEGIEVAHNRQYNIGDNGVGVGQLEHDVVAARNKNIQVHHNLIVKTRYHSILWAQAENSSSHNNTIHKGGAKSEMIGSSSVVLTGAITLLAGGVSPSNKGIKVYDNTIIDAYEYGIYAFDRPGTTLANASTGIELYNNTITGFGTLPTATRIASGGMVTQLQVAPKLTGNITTDGVGDGLRVFGDIKIMSHYAERITGSGINIPQDTLLGNTQLSGPLINCNVSDTTGAGISVWFKSSLRLLGCTAIRSGRGIAAPGTENGAAALNYAGFALRSNGSARLIGCSARECGSGGLVTQFTPIVKDTDGNYSANGQVFITNNFKSGAYLEGDGTTSVKATFINPVMDGGTTQYYPIRVLFGHADGVALDPEFVNHTSASIGITTKKLISI